MNSLEKLMAALGLDTSEFDQGIENSSGKATKFDGLLAGLGTTAKLGVAGVAALGGAAIAATGAIFGMTVKAASGADDMLTLSAKTGITVEQLQKLQYASELVDVPLTTMTGTLPFMTRAMAAAKDPTSAQADIFKTLGVNVFDANGQLRATNDVWLDSIDALGKVNNQADRDALALQLFGRSAADLNPLIVAGKDALTAYGDEAVRNGDVMSNDQVNALGAVDDAMVRVKNNLGGLTNQLASIFAPSIANVLGVVGGYVGQFTAIIGDNTLTAGEKIGQASALVGTIANGISSALPGLINTGLGIIQAIVTGIISSIPTLMPALVEVIISIVNMLVTLLPALVDAAIQIVVALATGLAAALPTLIPAIVNMVIMIVQTLVNNIGLILNAGIQILLGLVNGIVAALPNLIQQLPVIIMTIVNVLLANLPMIIQAALHIVLALIQGLITSIPMLMQEAPQLVVSIVTALINALPMIIKAGIDLIVGLGYGIGTMLKPITDIGVNIITGFWNGLRSKFQAIWDDITNFVNGIVEKLKGILGISSPSTVFHDIGANMMLGLANGLKDFAQIPMALLSNFGDGISLPELATTLNLNATNIPTNIPVAASTASSGSSDSDDVKVLLRKIADILDDQKQFFPAAMKDALTGINQ